MLKLIKFRFEKIKLTFEELNAAKSCFFEINLNQKQTYAGKVTEIFRSQFL